MPSKQTTNYELNQWVKTDKVLMEDFNADNKKIDDAIKAVDNRLTTVAGGKADVSALESLKQTVTGQSAALDKKGNCRIECFSHAGTGTNAVTGSVKFSAKPLFFLITGPGVLILGGGAYGEKANCVYNVDGRAGTSTLTVSWSGSTATFSGDSRTVPNQSGDTYLVTALHAMDA